MPPILTDNPEPGDILSVSQVDLRNNAQYVQNAFDKDHIVTFGIDSSAVALQGRHRQVSFDMGASNNAPLPAGTDGLLYDFSANLYFRGAGYANTVKLTNSNALPLSAANGFSFLPSQGNVAGGIVVQWGLGTSINPAGTTTIVFPTPFSAAAYVVVGNPLFAGNTLALQINTKTANNFTCRVFTTLNGATQPSIPFSWIAIGPK